MARSILSTFILGAMLIPLFATDPVEAQDRDLHVTIDPQSGSGGTVVNISGSGAPPDEEVVVSFSPWAQDQECETPRGGDLVATVTSNANGEFHATHTAERFDDVHVGNTYLAFTPRVEAPEPMSNLECFEFDSTDQPRHFDLTGYWVSGRFLAFWDGNGGLPVFGYPLSDELHEDGVDVQYFERQRFELHPDNEPPFDVLLGHLGAQAAAERGLLESRPFQSVDDVSGDVESCVFFEEIGHTACDEFLAYWQSEGLDLGDDGVSHRESLMLFGYPISEEFTDPDSGMTVQYFERAKLEHHPENESPWRVIPERLGATLFDR